MNLKKLNRILIVCWLLLAAADCVTTHFSLLNTNNMEGNPFAAALLDVSEPFAYAVKMVVSLIVAAYVWRVNNERQVGVAIVNAIVLTAYIAIVVNNTMNIGSV